MFSHYIVRNVAIVGFFVLVKAFFEIAMQFETMRVGHFAAFLVCFYVVSLFAEFFKLPVENLILLELTVKRTVENGNLYARFQTYALEKFFVVAYNPCLVAHKLVLESFAYCLIEQGQCRVAFYY